MCKKKCMNWSKRREFKVRKLITTYIIIIANQILSNLRDITDNFLWGSIYDCYVGLCSIFVGSHKKLEFLNTYISQLSKSNRPKFCIFVRISWIWLDRRTITMPKNLQWMTILRYKKTNFRTIWILK